MRKTLSVVGLSLGLWLFVWSLGVHVTFMRAESGHFLEASVLPWPDMKEFIRGSILRSYNGHFTPVAFLLELGQARLFQATGWLWMARQMLVLGLLAASIMWLITRVSKSQLLGFSISLAFVCQPTMVELAMWPFMALQLLCLAVMAGAAIFLAKFAEDGRDQDLACFLGLGYLTMHLFGVGAAISVAANITAGTLVLQQRVRMRARTILLLGAVLLTAIHGYMMARWTEPGSGPAVPLGQSFLRFGVLFLESIYSAVRGGWGNGGFVWPRTDVLAMQGTYGLALLAALLLALWRLRARAAVRPLHVRAGCIL
jgi:hypothetical protein